jgi:predicted membrane metal-binding protein
MEPSMRTSLFITGLILLIIFLFLYFANIVFSLTWPFLLIGVPLMLLGLVLPKPGSSWLKKKIHTCPTCGADLPDDATICPACGKLH